MSWVVRAPDRKLAQAEKKLYSRARRILWDYEPLRASHAEIFIDVEGANVRLRGRVRSLPQKLIAAMLIARIADVGAVTNDLIADPEVVRAVADALAEDERTAAYVLRVDSRHGLAILRGEVPTEAVQQAAIDIASSLPVVHSVRNQLTIGGRALPAIALSRPSTRADEPDPAAASEVRA